MEIREVGALSRLEDVPLAMDVVDFIYLKHFCLINLLQGEMVPLQIDQSDDSVAAAPQISHPLEILFRDFIKLRQAFRVFLAQRGCCR